jgi:hypothetical protein
MQFVRLGKYFAVARITGPTHNLLQVRFSNKGDSAVVCECLAPREPGPTLDEANLVANVLNGVVRANQKFRLSHQVTHIRYIATDSNPESTYEQLAYKLVERLAEGGKFQEAEPQ